jgi:uncharacterized protein YjbI with pentapeptide repeats
MANKEHLEILRQGVRTWNAWRARHPKMGPDLTNADLRNARLRGVNFADANLSGANLNRANLKRAKLVHANLHNINLKSTDLTEADLSYSFLRESNLSHAIIVETNLNKSNISGSRVYGVSIWNISIDNALQSDLIITKPNESEITVDNLEVAQFIHLMLNNRKIRQVIDTITSKVVLILGRFSLERKPVLDTIREKLREYNYLPILFDFEKPDNRDLTETISTLAHMSKFIIVDISDAKSVPQELQSIVPNLPSVPIQPILLSSQREYGMFEHFKKYPWVLTPFLYDDHTCLIRAIREKVIFPAETRANKLK